MTQISFSSKISNCFNFNSLCNSFQIENCSDRQQVSYEDFKKEILEQGEHLSQLSPLQSPKDTLLSYSIKQSTPLMQSN